MMRLHIRPTISAASLFLTVLGCGLAAARAGNDAAPPPPAVLAAEAQRIAVMAKAKEAVLAIFDPGGQGGGSGVIVSADGYALSNFHVAQPCGAAMKCGMADGRVYDAVVVGLDPTGDVALVKVLGRDDFPLAKLGDSDRLRAGDWVFAMGNPFLLATDFQPTVTGGIVSGVHRYQFPSGTLLEYADCIQTDASINPGNSGGPLFDAEGRLVGINGRCSFDKRGRVSVNVGYAISINQIKNFLGYLHSGRIVDHATLGATVSSDDQGRVVVSDILEQSDAFRRGLRTDDEILSFGGRQITTPNGFKNALGIYPRGWRVPLSYRRDGKQYDVLVRLAGVHSREQLIEKALGRPPDLMPIPKPGEKPGPKDGKKGPSPKIPAPKMPGPKMPMPLGNLVPKPPMPDVVKKQYEDKRGFANYFFNKFERDRVLKAWKPPADAKGPAGAWLLSGKLDAGTGFRLHVSDKDGLLEVLNAAKTAVKWSLGQQFAASLGKEGSDHILPALFLWRKLALEGPKAFGDVYYLGTAPVAGHEGLVDVLVSSFRGVDCWFYVDSPTGRLLALELYDDDRSDPCEIAFADYRDVDGHFLPGRMEVRWHDEVYGVFKIEQFKPEAKEARP